MADKPLIAVKLDTQAVDALLTRIQKATGNVQEHNKRLQD